MNDTVRIRRARSDEADRLTEIALAAKRHWWYPVAWIEAWREGLTFTPAFVTAHPVYVAVDSDDQPLACYGLVDDGAVHLEHLWVDPSAMGRGLGRMLFAHAVATAQARAATTLYIDSDPNAAPFYERMGARRVGTLRADVCGTLRELPRLRYDLHEERPER